jgi:hypothetical protein
LKIFAIVAFIFSAIKAQKNTQWYNYEKVRNKIKFVKNVHFPQSSEGATENDLPVVKTTHQEETIVVPFSFIFKVGV